MSLKVQTTPVLNQGFEAEKRQEIRDYFISTWELYEKLFEVIKGDEAYFLRADPLRHPLIFYLGHTATFFVNKMALAKLITERVNPEFESAFAIGVDEMSWDDLDDNNYNWPTVAAVYEYRNKVRSVILKVIDELPLTLPVSWTDPFWTILMGIEHERIHLETSSVLIRQLPLDHVRKHPDWSVCPDSGPAPANEMLAVPGGQVTLGKDHSHNLYGWDNEYGSLKKTVTPFKAAKFLVSNDEFREFVEAGGYTNEAWWTEEGWAWKIYKKAAQPLFWHGDADKGYQLRCMTELIDMPWNWPVEVNQLEAKAFCNWKAEMTGKPIRLPIEAEWHALLNHVGLPDQPDWNGSQGNINLAHYASSCPVDKHLNAGFGDVQGNVWQWTETPIGGFPGFEVHPIYDDFSVPTFDTQHNLMKGGSWISTGNEATRHARYAFRRHFYQHAGFRYIDSNQTVNLEADIYESDNLVSQYCEFHYGADYHGVANFPRVTAELCHEIIGDRPIKRALDLGCATGRAAFELARFCDFVTGIDFSARFVKVGHDMQEKGRIRYALPEEGKLMSYHEKTLAEMDLAEVQDKVEFWQGDAHNLKPQFKDYDLVLACNLIDRLYEPSRFLANIRERMTPGAVLVLFSPYTWLEEFTPVERWLGGKKVDGENVTTLEGLQQELAPPFEQIGEARDVEFVIRETRRKYQHSISQMSAWRKTD